MRKIQDIYIISITAILCCNCRIDTKTPLNIFCVQQISKFVYCKAFTKKDRRKHHDWSSRNQERHNTQELLQTSRQTTWKAKTTYRAPHISQHSHQQQMNYTDYTWACLGHTMTPLLTEQVNPWQIKLDTTSNKERQKKCARKKSVQLKALQDWTADALD